MSFAGSSADRLSPRPRRLHLRMLCGIALASLLTVSGVVAEERIFAFDVPAQSLATAIDEVQAKTDSRIVYSPTQVGGIEVVGLSGNYTVTAALRELLAGSGLTAKRDRGGTIVIVPLSPPSGSGSDEEVRP